MHVTTCLALPQARSPQSKIEQVSKRPSASMIAAGHIDTRSAGQITWVQADRLAAHKVCGKACTVRIFWLSPTYRQGSISLCRACYKKATADVFVIGISKQFKICAQARTQMQLELGPVLQRKLGITYRFHVLTVQHCGSPSGACRAMAQQLCTEAARLECRGGLFPFPTAYPTFPHFGEQGRNFVNFMQPKNSCHLVHRRCHSALSISYCLLIRRRLCMRRGQVCALACPCMQDLHIFI